MEVQKFYYELLQLKKDSPSRTSIHTVIKHESEVSKDKSSASSLFDSTKDTASRRTLTPVQRSSAGHLHPSGVREMSSHMKKFSGKRAKDDTFEVWLDDFEEPITDCGWTDDMKSRWFS